MTASRSIICVMTGYGDLEAAQQAIRLGVADFLTKPCSLGDLEHALDRAWRRCITQPEGSILAKPAMMSVPTSEEQPEDGDAPEHSRTWRKTSSSPHSIVTKATAPPQHAN